MARNETVTSFNKLSKSDIRVVISFLFMVIFTFYFLKYVMLNRFLNELVFLARRSIGDMKLLYGIYRIKIDGLLFEV